MAQALGEALLRLHRVPRKAEQQLEAKGMKRQLAGLP